MLKLIENTFKAALAFLLGFLFRSTPVSSPSADAVKKILVIRQHNQLGDMLCVVPLLRALREKYPTAIFTLMASPVNAGIMEHNRFLNDILVFDKDEFLGAMWLRVGRLAKFIGQVRRREFDLVLVPSTVSVSFTSTLLAFLSGARARVGVRRLDGAEHPGAFLFNLPVDLDWRSDPHRHQTLRNLDIGKPLGLTTSDLRGEMTLQKGELEEGKNAVEKFLGDQFKKGPKVALHPGAGKIPNQWPAARFASVANLLASELDAALFVTQGPMDGEPVCEMTSLLKTRHFVIADRPIREVAAILAQMDLVISNDTGIMHVAAAVGVPVLSLFGPTDPLQWAPQGEGHRFILADGGEISAITVEEVLRAAREMLRT